MNHKSCVAYYLPVGTEEKHEDSVRMADSGWKFEFDVYWELSVQLSAMCGRKSYVFCDCRAQNVMDKIYNVIRELAGESKTVKMADVMERCTSKGYKPDQVEECLEEYEELNVWLINQARTKITFV